MNTWAHKALVCDVEPKVLQQREPACHIAPLPLSRRHKGARPGAGATWPVCRKQRDCTTAAQSNPVAANPTGTKMAPAPSSGSRRHNPDPCAAVARAGADRSQARPAGSLRVGHAALAALLTAALAFEPASLAALVPCSATC